MNIINYLTRSNWGVEGKKIDDNFKLTINKPTISDLCMPSKLYLLASAIDLFFKPIVKNFYKKDKQIRLAVTNATLDRHYDNLATITPSANGVATFSIYDEDFNKFDKIVNTVVTPASKTGDLGVMFIGNSLTYQGWFIDKVNTVCAAGLTFLGIRKLTSSSLYCEGRGGWKLRYYFRTSDTAHNGFWQPTVGRYWGKTDFWTYVMNHGEFAGDYDRDGFKTKATEVGFSLTGYKSNPIVDDLMYDSTLASYIKWDGSAWVPTISPASWGFSFAKYCSMWNVAIPNVVCLELGLNEFRANDYESTYAAWNAQAALVLASLKAINANAKLAIIIPPSTAGLEKQASVSTFVLLANFNMWNFRKNLIDTFDNREAEGYYLIDSGISLDDEYGFLDASTTLPNQFYTGTERLRVQWGSPHPKIDGYNMMGNIIAGFIQFARGV